MGSGCWIGVPLLLLLMLHITTVPVSSSPSPLEDGDTCSDPIPSSSMSFLDDLNLQCPPHFPQSPSPPLQMDGDSFERLLSFASKDVHIAVLFYDSTSPFSATAFPLLQQFFPYISHFALPKSSLFPSLFSRYGIHSLPALFIINQKGHMRYYGHKHLHSIILFYKRTTGLDPAEYVICNEDIDIIDDQIEVQPWYQLSWREMIVKEPFLVFATLFLILRLSIYVYPGVLCRIASLWMLCKWQYNLGMFGESGQLLGRVLHLIDVKRVCKTRNFQKGARSARVWASSLASVSLGETYSARPSSSVES